jgi:hypothetical protein
VTDAVRERLEDRPAEALTLSLSGLELRAWRIAAG